MSNMKRLKAEVIPNNVASVLDELIARYTNFSKLSSDNETQKMELGDLKVLAFAIYNAGYAECKQHIQDKMKYQMYTGGLNGV